MDLIEGIETRRSFRGFQNLPIPKDVLKKILKATAQSPSYKNTQPWEVAVVCGKKKNDLSEMLCDLATSKAEVHPDIPDPQGWPAEHEARAREHVARRLAAVGVEREDKEERANLSLLNFKFYGGPCAIFLFMDRSLEEWSIFDMGLFTQNLILAAHAFGIGTCLQASVTNYAPEIRKFLKVPESKSLVLCISLGYPDMKARINADRANKLTPDDFTIWYH